MKSFTYAGRVYQVREATLDTIETHFANLLPALHAGETTLVRIAQHYLGPIPMPCDELRAGFLYLASQPRIALAA